MFPYSNRVILPISGFSLALLVFVTPALAQSGGAGDFLSADKKGSAAANALFDRKAPSKGGVKPPQGWSGKGSAGLVVSTGNTENNSVNLGLNVTYINDPWRHTVAATTYFAENNGEKEAERYAISHKANYSMGDRGYVFNFLSYDSDEFANIDSRLADVVGYGRNLIDTEKHNLDVELGVGYRQTRFTNNDPDSDETVGHAGLNYIGQITPTTTLTENLLIQGGSDNIFTESVTALNVKMTDKLSLSLNYTVRNNSEVAAGREKTDTVTSINLVTGF